MSTHILTIAVTTDILLADEDAITVAGEWAAATGLDLSMTSTSRDEPWLRVSGIHIAKDNGKPLETVLVGAVAELVIALGARGASVTSWDIIEAISGAELERRSRRPAIPPMVSAAELAEMAGVTPQAIYGYESARKTGKPRGEGFPAPALDGFWLKSTAEHWVRTRKTTRGPARRTEKS